MCNLCFWQCAGTLYQEDGRPWKVVGHPDDPHCEGRLCTRGTGGIGAYTDVDRLRQPLLRVEEGGRQSFKPVSWGEAFEFIATRMQTIGEKHGKDRLALFSHGDGGKPQQGRNGVGDYYGLPRRESPFPETEGYMIRTAQHDRHPPAVPDVHDKQHVKQRNAQDDRRRQRPGAPRP